MAPLNFAFRLSIYRASKPCVLQSQKLILVQGIKIGQKDEPAYIAICGSERNMKPISSSIIICRLYTLMTDKQKLCIQYANSVYAVSSSIDV